MKWIGVILLLAVGFAVLKNFKPAAKGLISGKLAPCGDRPNCVCSVDLREDFHIESISNFDKQKPLFKLIQIIQNNPNLSISDQSENYLHVVASTKLGFKDDLEFYYSKEEGLIHVRSESRVGYSDMEVNRKRLESIRQELSEN